MRVIWAFTVAAAVCTTAIHVTPAAAECRMEKQCRWVNFKKVCTYVRVCR